MKGTKILVVDPESEYKDLCHNLGGNWVNAVGGSAGWINPLQVRPSPCEEGEAERLYPSMGAGMEASEGSEPHPLQEQDGADSGLCELVNLPCT